MAVVGRACLIIAFAVSLYGIAAAIQGIPGWPGGTVAVAAFGGSGSLTAAVPTMVSGSTTQTPQGQELS